MTQEEKKLVLKDICGRLPYEPFAQYEGKEWLVTGYGHGRVSLLPGIFSSVGGPCPLVEEVRPYLRPMSSMTVEERDEVKKYMKRKQIVNMAFYHATEKTYDWYNAHHFDYRGLIPLGLALEAKEGMYKTE